MTDVEELFARCMTTMASAQRSYDASLTPEERALNETCDCLFCQGMRDMRAAIVEWERERDEEGRRTTLLPPPCPDAGHPRANFREDE